MSNECDNTGTSVRLYFDDAYLTEFEAVVVERRVVDGRPAVVLERTAFYPESGGQPSDRGTLGAAAVVDVREEGGEILHILDREPEGNLVRGRIDWPRRFDHMQQHTGQHILSQAFDEILRGRTLSFHLGAESSSVEIGLAKAADADVERVERRANEVVFENREVRVSMVPAERIHEVPLRKPPQVEGIIRVVAVDAFDHSACGGTHVRRTGEIGLIKIAGSDRIRGNLRFEFLCGGRALRDYGVKNRIARELGGKFNVKPEEVPAAVERLGAELKEARRRAKKTEERLAGYEAAELAAAAEGRFITSVFDDRGPDAAKALALSLIRQGNFIVVFGARSDARSHVVAARAAAVDVDLRPLVNEIAPLLNGRGGGGPSLVEIAGDRGADLAAAVAKALEYLRPLAP